MIVDDLDVPGFAIAPHKADPPLIVNANADLTLAVAVQSLQTISGRHTQIVGLPGRVDRKQLTAGGPLNLRWLIKQPAAAHRARWLLHFRFEFLSDRTRPAGSSKILG